MVRTVTRRQPTSLDATSAAFGGTFLRVVLTLPEHVLRLKRLLNFSATLHNEHDPHDTFWNVEAHPSDRSLVFLWQSLRRGEFPVQVIRHLGNIVSE